MDIGLLSTIFRFIIFLVQIYYFGMIIYFFTLVPSIRESKFGEFFRKLYEPFLEPSKIIPPIGFIDISSIAAIFVLVLFQSGLVKYLILILAYLS